MTVGERTERSEHDGLPPGVVPLSGLPPGGPPPDLAEHHARLTPGLRRMFMARTAGGGDDLADDLAQRTWMNVWRAVSAGKFDPTLAAFSTFVYAVATNVWRQHLRDSMREKNRDVAAAAEAGMHAGNPTGLKPVDDAGDEAAALAEVLDILRKTMGGTGGSFSEDERWVLRCVADGASDRELAKRLGVSASTANDRKQGVFRKIRAFLSSRGLE